MKKIILIIFLFLSLQNVFSLDNTSDKINIPQKPKKEDTYNYNRLTFYDISKIIYWSSTASVWTFAFVNSFALLGNQSKISEDMKNAGKEMTDFTKIEAKSISVVADLLPGTVFGINFLLSGAAFIPVFGGVVYGMLLYTASLVMYTIKSLGPDDLFWYGTLFPSEFNSSIRQNIESLHARVFDPTPYFVVGTFAIIFGIVEIIFNYFYDRELKKRKYPNINKILTFTPMGIVIKLDV
ncbi:MAG: hypothetical protein A2Z98_14790 [Spirochaetes bacterium GWB1_27_13]|nr:MAG: hypothetical protein A2Z98_14790 [Spirochaetes bacterium GWB1_27_13]